MSFLHKTNGLPLQQTLALIKFIKMEPHNKETKNSPSNTLQMEAHLKETPINCHFWYACSEGLSTLKQRNKTNSNKHSIHSMDILNFIKINNDM